MKKVEMIIPAQAFDGVKSALMTRFNTEVMITASEMCSREGVRTQTYRGVEYLAECPRKVVLGLVIPEEDVDSLIEAVNAVIETTAHGEWKLLATPVEVRDYPRDLVFKPEALPFTGRNFGLQAAGTAH